MGSLSDIIIALRLATRAKIFTVMGYLVLAMVVIVLMVIEFSARQLSTVALDVGLSMIRIALPLLVILLTQELISKEFDRKLYLNVFTYPRSRVSWMFYRVATILFLGMILLAVMASVLALLTMYAQEYYTQATPVSLGLPYFITLGFIAVDLLVVTAISVLLAMSATTPSFVLIGTIGFTMIARSYSPIMQLLQTNPDAAIELVDPRLYQDSLGLIAWILPDLGRLDVRMIALYDKMMFFPSDWAWLLVATLAYTAALFALSAWILNKREFN